MSDRNSPGQLLVPPPSSGGKHRTPTVIQGRTLALLPDSGQLPPNLDATEAAEYRFLIELALIDGATLERAAALAAQGGQSVPRTLVSLGWVTEADYAAALARHLGVGVASHRNLSVPSNHAPMATSGAFEVREGDRPLLAVPAIDYEPSVLALWLAGRPASRDALVIVTSGEADALQLAPRMPAMLQHARLGLAFYDETYSALRTVTGGQAAALLLMVALVSFCFVTSPQLSTTVALMGMSVPIVCVSLMRIAGLWLLLGNGAETAAGGQPRKRPPDHELPLYSVLVALYREAEVAPRLVRALTLLDYPADRLEILVALEADDAETAAALAAVDLPGNFRVIRVPPSIPRTKPKALNYVLGMARGSLVVVYDAEDRPEPDQLRKALARFATAGPDLACLQARLNTYNPGAGWLTQQFTIEYTVLFDVLLPVLERLRLPLPLGGTSNHFRIEALRRVGGWDPHNVTEDADLGIRLARHGLQTGTLASTTWEEAPADFGNWKRQRTRWLKGWMQTWLVHLRSPRRVWRELGPWGLLGVHLLMSGILLSVLVYPLMLLLIGWQLAAGTFLDTGIQGLDLVVWWVAVGTLAAGLLSTIGLGAAAVWKRGWRRLALSAPLMPIYWLLISLAGYRALGQLVLKPHVWEKTTHGGPGAAVPPPGNGRRRPTTPA